MNIHRNPASTERIQAAIDRSPLNQSEIARRCGMSEVDISRYRSGLRKPASGRLARLALVLGVPVTDLMDSATADA